MWVNDPKMAERWAKHTPKGKKLPEKIRKKKSIVVEKSIFVRKNDSI
jgi:hypothetical protein